MKRWPSEASVKFLVKLFSKSLRLVRRSLTPLPLWRAAHEEKLGKQGLCPAFPGRWGSCPLSHGCRRASSPRGGAKSRLPLWGRCHAKGMTERATRQRPAQSRVPPPSLIPKGGTRLGRLDRKARRKPPWHRRCHQGSRLPPRSALNGAHWAPAPPGEGFLRKTVHRTIFLFSCAC